MHKITLDDFIFAANEAMNAIGITNTPVAIFYDNRVYGKRYYLTPCGIVELNCRTREKKYSALNEFYTMLSIYRRREFSVPGNELRKVYSLLNTIINEKKRFDRMASFNPFRFSPADFWE